MKDPLFTGAIWEYNFLGNTVYDYILAIGIFFLVSGFFKGFQWVVLRFVTRFTERTKTEWDDAIITIIRTIRPPFYWFVAFYLALRYLHVTGLAEQIVRFILVAWLVYQVIVAVRILIDFYVQQRLSDIDKESKAAANFIHKLVSISLWLLGILFLLQNFGVNVTSLIAGLGIGGVAVALAAQSVLTDLFSSLSIFFDKPFAPGDFVVFNGNMGTIEKIGIKTTRIKALQGEEIVVPNTQITSSTLNNYGRMEERRGAFTIGITYETPSEKMKKIPEMIEKIISDQRNTRFSRAHFKEFADFSLNYEVVYFVQSSKYEQYMDINQQIMLDIKEAFENEGIDMAYPTQTLYLNKQS